MKNGFTVNWQEEQGALNSRFELLAMRTVIQLMEVDLMMVWAQYNREASDDNKLPWNLEELLEKSSERKVLNQGGKA